LIPQERKSINVLNDFIQGKNHWSQAWALAIMEQFERRQKDKISISAKESSTNFHSSKTQPAMKFRSSLVADVRED
jgi:hypothetical protein